MFPFKPNFKKKPKKEKDPKESTPKEEKPSKEDILKGIKQFSEEVEQKTNSKELAERVVKKAESKAGIFQNKTNDEIAKDLHDIVEEEKKAMVEEEQNKLTNRLLKAIDEFEPFERYDNDLTYQVDLARHLSVHFPDVTTEYHANSAVPDVHLSCGSESVGLEVKGITTSEKLESIPNKAMNYPEKLDKIILVLFNLDVTKEFYEEWQAGMQKKFPEITIILK